MVVDVDASESAHVVVCARSGLAERPCYIVLQKWIYTFERTNIKIKYGFYFLRQSFLPIVLLYLWRGAADELAVEFFLRFKDQ